MEQNKPTSGGRRPAPRPTRPAQKPINDENKKEGGGKGTTIILIVLIVILLGVLGFFIYKTVKQDEELKNKQETIDSQLVENKQLVSKIDSINAILVEQKELLIKLGKDTVELQEKIVYWQEKAKVYRTYKSKADNRDRDLKALEAEMNAVLNAEREKTEKWKKLAEELGIETNLLKDTIQAKNDSITSLSTENQKLSDKVEIASRLKTEKVEIWGVSSKGKEKQKTKYKSKDIATLKVIYAFTKNEVADIATKEVVLRVIDPDGATLFDETSGSGTFTAVDGQELTFTAKKDYLFQNNGKDEVFNYKKGGDYKSGTHKVEIYCEGSFAGSAEFVVK